MTATHKSVLDTAGFVDWEIGQKLNQSDPSTGIIYTRAAAAEQTARRFTLRWEPGTWGQYALLRHHYNANKHGTFQIVVPRTNEIVDAIYLSGPRARRISAQAATISVELEEAVAID